jgi:hypothetical protein
LQYENTYYNIKTKYPKHLEHTVATYDPNKHTCNKRLKKQGKHLERMLATYVYDYCNMCNITIYFCNIHMEHLQHTSEIFETIKTYSCNIRFQCNISLLLGRMEAHRCVVFTGGSGPAALVGGEQAVVAVRRGRHRPHEGWGGRGRMTWRGQ